MTTQKESEAALDARLNTAYVQGEKSGLNRAERMLCELAGELFKQRRDIEAKFVRDSLLGKIHLLRDAVDRKIRSCKNVEIVTAQEDTE